MSIYLIRGQNANISVIKEPTTSTTTPTLESDPDILFGNDQENFVDFVFNTFTINQTSDDDDPTMTRCQFKQLMRN